MVTHDITESETKFTEAKILMKCIFLPVYLCAHPYWWVNRYFLTHVLEEPIVSGGHSSKGNDQPHLVPRYSGLSSYLGLNPSPKSLLLTLLSATTGKAAKNPLHKNQITSLNGIDINLFFLPNRQILNFSVFSCCVPGSSLQGSQGARYEIACPAFTGDLALAVGRWGEMPTTPHLHEYRTC